MHEIKVLIACEFSGVVRDAFLKEGFNAMSCDLEKSYMPGPHYQGNVFDIIDQNWDLMIAHPPCTHLAVSGARWFPNKEKEQEEALQFFQDLLEAPINFIAIENPISIVSTKIRPPNQIIEPWQFGHPEEKKICLWLQDLPELIPTHYVAGRSNRIHMMPGGNRQGKRRSVFYPGIAKAMANQWGEFVRQWT
ncbi:MAG TPA: DNA cytosine methyltransferase [Bacteroidia bacterium]|nr:DNA cytosine methyltransferase [Bacteroidia bacterium]